MLSPSRTDRVVVRVSDGKIVAGHSDVTIHSSDYDDGNIDPVARPIFDPACYRATSETQTTFEGAPAIRLDLVATCREKHPGGSSSNNVSVTVDERFATFDGHVMPSSMKVDVSGTGMMFWLQVHLQETYTDYQFLNSPSA